MAFDPVVLRVKVQLRIEQVPPDVYCGLGLQVEFKITLTSDPKLPYKVTIIELPIQLVATDSFAQKEAEPSLVERGGSRLAFSRCLEILAPAFEKLCLCKAKSRIKAPSCLLSSMRVHLWLMPVLHAAGMGRAQQVAAM
jgi:hypothetical protein